MEPAKYALTMNQIQYKKRRYNRDEDEDREKSPDLQDKLKDATTLYVGNL
jgi:nuclear cap-binding protein subunit 2